MTRHQATLTNQQLEAVAKDVLADRFEPFGFQALDIKEDKDIDGAAILHMIAEVRSRVPASDLIDTILVLRDALESEGDDRLVLLSTHVPGIGEPQEDEDQHEDE